MVRRSAVAFGAIAHGRSVLAAQAAGADLAYVGSAFIAAREANAAPDYKQCIVDSTASDIVYSNYFTGINGNFLRGSIAAAGLDPDKLPVVLGQGLETDPAQSKPKAWSEIWGSGQGIGVVDRIESTAEIVSRLRAEYEQAFDGITAAAWVKA